MKKILLLAVVLVASLTASAQVYVGGSIGFGSVKPIGGGDSEFTFKILPEIGYNLNDQWATGVILGYKKGTCSIGHGDYDASDAETFVINPYARYTAIEWDMVKLILDGGLSFESTKDFGSNFALGINPGIVVSLSDEISFVAHLGFLGFETFSPGDNLKARGYTKSGNEFGLDFRNNCSFGVYFNF